MGGVFKVHRLEACATCTTQKNAFLETLQQRGQISNRFDHGVG
jgi:hypothetical protein